MVVQAVENMAAVPCHEGDHTGHRGQRPIGEGLKQLWCAALALPTHHAVDSTLGVLQELLRDKRSAMPTYENKTLWQERLVTFARSMTSGTLAR